MYGSLRFKGIVSDHESTALAVIHIGFGIKIQQFGIVFCYLIFVVLRSISKVTVRGQEQITQISAGALWSIKHPMKHKFSTPLN